LYEFCFSSPQFFWLAWPLSTFWFSLSIGWPTTLTPFNHMLLVILFYGLPFSKLHNFSHRQSLWRQSQLKKLHLFIYFGIVEGALFANKTQHFYWNKLSVGIQKRVNF
jgi:hypothetical protein